MYTDYIPIAENKKTKKQSVRIWVEEYSGYILKTKRGYARAISLM